MGPDNAAQEITSTILKNIVQPPPFFDIYTENIQPHILYPQSQSLVKVQKVISHTTQTL